MWRMGSRDAVVVHFSRPALPDAVEAVAVTAGPGGMLAAGQAEPVSEAGPEGLRGLFLAVAEQPAQPVHGGAHAPASGGAGPGGAGLRGGPRRSPRPFPRGR